MKTLTEYTPEERRELVGMWAYVEEWGLCILSITDGIDYQGLNAEVVRFVDGRPIVDWARNGHIRPAWELPRAWTPQGDPA